MTHCLPSVSGGNLRLLTAWLVAISSVGAQTTQGLISGQVYDRQTGAPVPAVVECYQYSADQAHQTISSRRAVTNQQGFYALPFLTPGVYRIRAESPEYQAQELYEVEVRVAAQISMNLAMSPKKTLWNDVSEGRVPLADEVSVVHFFAADVEKLDSATIQILTQRTMSMQSTLSYVIDPDQLSGLPLSGHNVYELLLFQPGVTAGLSVNGQRSTSATLLLDGLETNTLLGPEFVHEYRVSTNNFSAEYGRATGFVANAITRSGSNAFHGLLFGYLNNQVLNANAFQSNKNGFPRQEHREVRPGFSVGGPLIKNKSFFFAGYEHFHSRTAEYPFTFQVPVLENLRRCPQTAGSQARALLERFPPPLVKAETAAPCDNLSAPYRLAIPIVINREFGLMRVDQLLRGGRNRLMARATIDRETDPYAIFSLYPEFTSPGKSGNYSAGLNFVASLSSNTTTEVRLGWLRSTNSLPRQHPEVPTLVTGVDGGKLYPQGISLPGISDLITTFQSRGESFEFGDSTIAVQGRHVITMGGSFYFRFSRTSSAYFQSGTYQFRDLQSFAQDRASSFSVSLGRDSVSAGGPFSQPQPSREYNRKQFYGFVQDSYRVSPRLGFDFGLRYDSFGTDNNKGAQDTYINLDRGTSVRDGLPTAQFVYSSACCRSSYSPSRSDWAGRVGLAYDVTGAGKHVFRAAYGIFYDPQPDLSTANNNVEVVTFFSKTDYITPSYSQLRLDSLSALASVPIPYLPQPLLIDRHLLAPRVQAWFAGFQHLLSSNLTFEINHTGAIGRRLFTSDIVNRQNASGTDDSRLNPSLPDILYRSNSGYSDYNALTALTRYRSSRVLFQLAYTLGHSIDNQSAPGAVFVRQFDTKLDRGNSDFDQRQNLVLYSVLRGPSFNKSGWLATLLRGWQVSGLMAFRSGFPYSLNADGVPGARPCNSNSMPGNDPMLLNNRPSLVGGISPVLSSPIPVPGGVQLLNPAAFCRPPSDTPGNLGRNSLRGPGSRAIDSSIGRSFALHWLGETAKIQVRADLFNVFNHANLGNPQVAATAFGTFGQAFYGTQAAPPGSVSIVPLDEVPRRIELQLRIYF